MTRMVGLRHLVVLTQENHSFDQVFWHFPGTPHPSPDLCLPRRRSHGCVRPFAAPSRRSGSRPSPKHSFHAIHQEWDDGKMDGFVRVNGMRTMEHFSWWQLPIYWKAAREGVLLDHYFCSVLGPTLPNRLFLVSGTSAGLRNDPLPFSKRTFDQPTVFDQLQAKAVSWKYYAGSYDGTYCSQAWARMLLFCPLFWFPRIMQSPPMRERIVPFPEFFSDAAHGNLPTVSYIAPGTWNSGHPPLGLGRAMQSFQAIWRCLEQSPTWDDTLLLLNFDEAGGFYDHIPPPVIDDYGPGIRVPALAISPRIDRGTICHTSFDHTSVVKLIEDWQGLPYLTARIRQMPSLMDIFV